MKVFISQPMRGKTDDEILLERSEAIEKIKQMTSEDIEILDSFFQNISADPLYLLGKSLELLSEADAAYFCEGWQDARGCRIEYSCCLAYEIKVLHC